MSFTLKICCPGGEIGRHKGLKIPRTLYVRAGSTPALGTSLKDHQILFLCQQLNHLFSGPIF